MRLLEVFFYSYPIRAPIRHLTLFAGKHSEIQLAHKVKDANGHAYNRTSFWEARVKMMQSWADYLDLLKAGGEVIPLTNSA